MTTSEKLDNITLYNADCMDIMQEMPDNAFDLAIVDPPYFPEANLHYHNGAAVSKTGVKRRNYHRSQSWDVPTQEYYDELLRVSKEQIIWGINYFDFAGVPVGRIVWDKQRSGLIDSFSDAEIASCSLIKGIRIYQYRWDGMLQGNMKNKEKKIHVTQKPVSLYKWILDKYAKDGDKILDTHGGSMSSAIAAHDMGFEMTIIEKDPEYFATARRRLQWHQAQQKLF